MAASRSTAMRNLTLASAKHLLKAGHISPKTHKSIVKKVGGKMKPPAMEMAPPEDAAQQPLQFGSLDPSAAAAAAPAGLPSPGMAPPAAPMPGPGPMGMLGAPPLLR